MKHFTLGYLILLPLLFALFFFDISPIANFVNTYQTKLSLLFLSHSLDAGRVVGTDIWVNPHYKIFITNACNGMIPILVLEYHASWFKKILWIGIGYIAFTITNLVRLYAVAILVKKQSEFHFYHTILGNILLLVVGLVLFYLFLNSTKHQRVTR